MPLKEIAANANEELSVQKLVTKLNNNYVHWDKFKDMQLPDPDYRIMIWAKALSERQQGFTRKFNLPEIGPISWWLSNDMEALLHQMDINMAGGHSLEILVQPKQIHRHRTNALLDESIASAQLAGITVSKKAAKEMLLKKRPPQNINEQACINIHKSLQQVIDNKNAPLNEELLLQLHHLLTKDTIKLKGIGRYRTNNKTDISSIDNSANYTPVDAKKIPDLMPVLFDLFNNDAEPFFIHPLVKACLLHYMLVSIRPFRDANGRLARLLANFYLLKKGYWVAEFISVSNVITKFKAQYHKSLVQSQTDENNIGYFIHFYLQSMQMAYKSLSSFASRLAKEKAENVAPKLPGYNERQTVVVKWVKDDPEKIVTIRELRSVYGISKETARTDLTMLVEKGLLKYYHINKKTYAFVMGEKFKGLTW